MRLAPQQILVSGHLVHIWMLPPWWFSLVLDDGGTLWTFTGNQWVGTIGNARRAQ